MSKQEKTIEVKNLTAAPAVFHDNAFKARTIVLPDGRTFPVLKNTIEATDPALISYLDAHADFSRSVAAQS